MVGGVRESASQIERELRALITEQSELEEKNADLAEQIKAEIQLHIPIDQGHLVGTIVIKKLRNTRDHPLPGRLIYSTSPLFHLIEYGTKADPDSTKEPRRVNIGGGYWLTLTRNTPTAAVAPFGKARAKFGDRMR